MRSPLFCFALLQQERVALLAGFFGRDQPQRRPATTGPFVALVVGEFHRHALAFARPRALAALAERDRALPILVRQPVTGDQRYQLRDFLIGLGFDVLSPFFQRANLSADYGQRFNARHSRSSVSIEKT